MNQTQNNSQNHQPSLQKLTLSQTLHTLKIFDRMLTNTHHQSIRFIPSVNLCLLDESLQIVQIIHKIINDTQSLQQTYSIELSKSITKASQYPNEIAVFHQKYHQLCIKNQDLKQQSQNKRKCKNAMIQNLHKVKQERDMMEKLYAQYCASYKQLNNQLQIVKYTNEKNDTLSASLYGCKRKMNNELQTIKGNIRVYCRIRPFQNGSSNHEIQEDPYFKINNGSINFTLPKGILKSQNHRKQFNYSFEEVFNNAPQQLVFEQFSTLIDSVIDGKNVCIFAYGQTGSGKTYTMQGGITESSFGIIPRSIRKIFYNIQEAEGYKWKYQLFAQCVEIYNDQIRDLLSTQPGKKEKEYTLVKISSQEHITKLLQTANTNRKVAGTLCNQRSSRSHMIFTIKLIGVCGNQLRESSLNLVDLAGSQRIQRSDVKGDRLKQTTFINTSLSALGLVIQTMVNNKQQHIPFRNSKLTYFLQPFLTGDSKTIMMLCISPLPNDWTQTQACLSFAENAKKVVTQRNSTKQTNQRNSS